MTAPQFVGDTSTEPSTFRSYRTETVGYVQWARTEELVPKDCPQDERWIFENPDIIGSIRRDVGQAAEGKKKRHSILDPADGDK